MKTARILFNAAKEAGLPHHARGMGTGIQTDRTYAPIVFVISLFCSCDIHTANLVRHLRVSPCTTHNAPFFRLDRSLILFFFFFFHFSLVIITVRVARVHCVCILIDNL